MRVVVAGHICLDIIPKWVRGDIKAIIPGRIIDMDGIKFSVGGAVANTGLALNRLGVDTTLLGKIGDDVIGQITLDILKKEDEKIANKMIVASGEASSYTVVLTPPNTDRIFFHYPGTNHTFRAEDISYKNIEGANLLHFGYPPLMRQMYQNEGDGLIEIFKMASKMGLITSLDMATPDPDSEAGKVNWSQLLKNVLPYVDIFLPSIEELLYMMDRTTFARILNNTDVLTIELLDCLAMQLLQWGTKIIVIKLGEQGLYLRTGDMHNLSIADRESKLFDSISFERWSKRRLLSPCFLTNVAGTTGAGDAAIAGFLAKFLEGAIPEETLTVAAAVGACSVETLDAVSGISSLSAVTERIKAGWAQLPVKFLCDGWRYSKQFGLWKACGSNL